MTAVRTFTAALLCAASLAAQTTPAPDATTASRTRLQKALQTMQQLDRCAFAAKWGPDVEPGEKIKDGDAPIAVFMANGVGPGGPGEAKGTWANNLLHCTLGDDEVVLGNRHLLARSKDGAWQLRRQKRADGSPLGFLPDPQQLLQLLAPWDLAVTHREVGNLDDKPVEILTVTLNDDQVAEAIWSGLLPDAASNPFQVMRGRVVALQNVVVQGQALGGAAAAKPALPKPEATIDIAFFLDPATALLHKLEVRCWQKLETGNGAFRVQMVANGGAVVAKNDGVDEDSEEEQKKAEAAAKAPLTYKDGLPQRPRKKMTVDGFGISFTQHGKAALPALDDKAKGLLGVK